MREIVVATDGSALDNPKGAAGWAWFVDEDRWDYGGIEKGSNQLAEAMAIYRALASLPKEVPVRIQTDSQFWINVLGKDGVSGWRAGWKRRGWVKPDGKPPANLKVLQAIDELIVKKRRAPVVFEWVKGHGTHLLNNVADRLCTHASFQIREGTTVRGPGWRARSASAMYPYELPTSARKVLDAPMAPEGQVVKRRATKSEISARKEEAAKKQATSPLSPSAPKVASKTPPAPPKRVTAPAAPTARKQQTKPVTRPAVKPPQQRSTPSVIRPTGGRRKTPVSSTKAYKEAVLNPPTASQRAKMEAELKRKAAAKKKIAQDPSVISFFSEDDMDNVPTVGGERKKDTKEYCSSCDRPINPHTGECGKCSF